MADVAAGHPGAEGTWLVADRQTGGRGRLGRGWQDGAGNFMGSTTVTLREDDPPAHSLALVAAIAVYDTVRGLLSADAPSLLIKWPNDLMLGGAKLCGILLERSGQHVIVGIGINIASAPQLPDRATTALADHGVIANRDDVAERLATRFADVLGQWRSGAWPDAIIADWMARAHPVGSPMEMAVPGQAGLTGTFDGLERDGGLRLRDAAGAVTVIHAGDVSLIAGR